VPQSIGQIVLILSIWMEWSRVEWLLLLLPLPPRRRTSRDVNAARGSHGAEGRRQVLRQLNCGGHTMELAGGILAALMATDSAPATGGCGLEAAADRRANKQQN